MVTARYVLGVAINRYLQQLETSHMTAPQLISSLNNYAIRKLLILMLSFIPVSLLSDRVLLQVIARKL